MIGFSDTYGSALIKPGVVGISVQGEDHVPWVRLDNRDRDRNEVARESKLISAVPISSKLAPAIGFRARITRSHPVLMLGI